LTTRFLFPKVGNRAKKWFFVGKISLGAPVQFAGITALSLDAKGRMTIPARYRDALLAQSKGALALVESDDGCLILMAQSLWEEKTASFSESDSDNERRRFWLGLSDTPEMDGQGRVLINPVLRDGACIQRDVVLLGVGQHFEIWDSATLESHKQSVRQRKRGGA
jgi:MraZ protein